MRIDHISVSRKGVFDLCQMKYKFQYHLKAITPAEEPIYFLYGSIVHRAAELYVAAKGERLITEVAQDLLGGKVDLEPGKKCPPIPPEYKKKFPEHLHNIQKLTEKTGFGGKQEWEFYFDLDPPHNRHVLGYIDRLIIQDNKAWIIDYKTTKIGWWRKTARDIVDDLQLRCYAAVVRKEFKIPAQNISCALYYLEGAELLGAKFSEQSLDQVEKELLQTYIEIQTTDPNLVSGRVGEHCKNCDFRKICPTYSLV